MTKKHFKNSNCNSKYVSFGGNVYSSDFYRKTTLSDMAARIESDKRFDELCKRNANNRITKENSNEEGQTC